MRASTSKKGIAPAYSICRGANLGDRYASPALYFPYGPLRHVREWEAGDAVVGGGYILSMPITPTHQGRIVAWGVDGRATWLPRCVAAGVRDWPLLAPWMDWVPCASCMLPFGDLPAPAVPVVVYDNSDHPVRAACPPSWPRRTNQAASDDLPSELERALRFLASGEVVITSSHHGAYWATLMGRRVVVDDWSPKLQRLKWKAICLSSSRLDTAIRTARSYPGALAEARRANTEFHKKVLGVFGARQ